MHSHVWYLCVDPDIGSYRMVMSEVNAITVVGNCFYEYVFVRQGSGLMLMDD